jgi:hypothetical protein
VDPPARLHTPIYLKVDPDMPLPQDAAFHLLSGDGLFLCRNHEFFTSCVPTERWPSELAGQAPFLKLRYPRLPRRPLERVVGFFDLVGRRFGSEAAVLIAWDREARCVQFLVPEQCGVVGTSWHGEPYPISVDYEVPPLPPHLQLIGDIHSHVDGPAYASATDKDDERHRAGLHLVVGRLYKEPPEFHCEVTVDGHRFLVRDLSAVLAGYRRRRCDEVPREWFDKLTIRPWNSAARSLANDSAGTTRQGADDGKPWEVQAEGADGPAARHEGQPPPAEGPPGSHNGEVRP